MRDFLVVMIVLGSVPLILIRPQVGIIMWFWLGMMNPHRLTWGYAQEFRVALVVGIATLLAWLYSREPKAPPNTATVWTLVAFTFWVSVAALFAIHPEVAIPKWEEIIKILLMTFVTMCIVQTRERIDQLVWVIVVSLGIYGVKGGLFTIVTGGHYRVYGPEGSFIEENNALALALIVLLPLMQYLRVNAKLPWVRLGLMASMGLTIIAILASYSRGALVGIAMTLGFLLLKAKRRFLTLILTGGMLVVGLLIAPAEWYERMDTIPDYQQDESAEGRFDAWNFAYRLALDHPFVGGGQLIGTDDKLFKQYVPTAPTARAAHSIYFEVLGETGFVGLGLFLLLLLASYRAGSTIIRLTRNRPDLAWARSLAAMLQVSIVGYATTGAFLSLGFFDLFYALVAIVTVTLVVVRKEVAKSPASAGAATGPPPLGLRPFGRPAPALARAAETVAVPRGLAGS